MKKLYWEIGIKLWKFFNEDIRIAYYISRTDRLICIIEYNVINGSHRSMV